MVDGATYEGEWLNGLRHGFGKYVNYFEFIRISAGRMALYMREITLRMNNMV